MQKEMVHDYDFSQMLCKAIDIKEIRKDFFNVGNGFPVTLEGEIKTIIDVFSKDSRKSKIIYRPDMRSYQGDIMCIDNARRLLRYKPYYTCKELMLDIKAEKEKYSFAELND